MRVKKVQLKEFKRFDNLTIDLGENPNKIVALVGPNGCGKSSVFDAFEVEMKKLGNRNQEKLSFYSKAMFYAEQQENYNHDLYQSIKIVADAYQLNQKSFYIRTAYRFTPGINVDSIQQLGDILWTQDHPKSLISLDQRLVGNYQRLIANAYDEFDVIGTKTGNQVKEELLSKINSVLEAVLDVRVSSLGNVTKGRGQLYFEKGNTKNFPYENLSSGEKEVIDIVIDLIVKREVYNDTVYCIDEPELHINTSIQRKLLIEIEKLIPDNCQLWIATHSIGFLRALQEELRSKTQIIDFSEQDYFTGEKTIVPIRMNRSNWQRIFSTALEDLTGLIAPKTIVYSEGKMMTNHREEKGLDAKVFNQIFGEIYPNTLFVSAGGNTELDQRSEIAIAILGKVFTEIEIWILKDRDFDSGNYTDETKRQHYLKSNPNNHRILNRWEIENYLYDKEILKKYCAHQQLIFNEVKYDGKVTDITNENVKDQFSLIKACCSISYNISAEAFKLDLSGYITPETQVFNELTTSIFARK